MAAAQGIEATLLEQVLSSGNIGAGLCVLIVVFGSRVGIRVSRQVAEMQKSFLDSSKEGQDAFQGQIERLHEDQKEMHRELMTELRALRGRT